MSDDTLITIMPSFTQWLSKILHSNKDIEQDAQYQLSKDRLFLLDSRLYLLLIEVYHSSKARYQARGVPCQT